MYLGHRPPRPLQQTRPACLSRSVSAVSAREHVSLGECTLCTTRREDAAWHGKGDSGISQFAWLATHTYVCRYVAYQSCRVPSSPFLCRICSLLNCSNVEADRGTFTPALGCCSPPYAASFHLRAAWLRIPSLRASLPFPSAHHCRLAVLLNINCLLSLIGLYHRSIPAFYPPNRLQHPAYPQPRAYVRHLSIHQGNSNELSLFATATAPTTQCTSAALYRCFFC